MERTYSTTQKEIAEAQAEQRRLTVKSSLTATEKAELLKLEGRIETLRELADDQHEAETRALIASARPRFAMSGETATSPEIAEFRAYLRTGEETRASMVTTNTSGYALPNAAVEKIIDLAKDADPIFAHARRFWLDGGASSIEVPVQTADGAVSWVGETDARAETDSPTFAQHTIVAYEVYGNWFATQQLLDSQPYIENWIAEEMGRTLLQAAGVRFATGDGSSAILGLFSNVTDGYTIRLSGAANALQSSALAAAFFDLPSAYHGNAAWIMSPATLSTCTGFDDPNTSATTPLVKWEQGTPMIMGKPVLLCDNAPAVGDGAYPVAFADIGRAYGIAIHRDVSVLRDPYTNKPYVCFYGLARIGGYPLDPEACVLIKSDDA